MESWFLQAFPVKKVGISARPLDISNKLDRLFTTIWR